MSAPLTLSVAPARAVAGHRRLVAAILAVGVALAVLVAPQFTPSSSAATRLTPAYGRQLARQMLSWVNAERRAHHLPAVKMNSKLVLSAHRHNLTMAKHNTMSHQLRGEAFFANRISHTGYRWRDAGENIGYNTNRSSSGLAALQSAMYREKAPFNGHRLNILSRNFRDIGIDVYFDAKHHKMWFTQDFGRRA